MHWFDAHLRRNGSGKMLHFVFYNQALCFPMGRKRCCAVKIHSLGDMITQVQAAVSRPCSLALHCLVRWHSWCKVCMLCAQNQGSAERWWHSHESQHSGGRGRGNLWIWGYLVYRESSRTARATQRNPVLTKPIRKGRKRKRRRRRSKVYLCVQSNTATVFNF